MRIEVVGDDTISRQARTYAEYRLFAALSQVVDTNRVRHAQLTLRRVRPAGACDGISCTVIVHLEDTNELRFRVSADHPYAAVNRAVDRLRDGRASSRDGDGARLAPAVAE